MLLTGCILARDEAAALPECLASLAGAVDALVVVDHGSRDATRAIAEAAGATVIASGAPFHEHARNAYLDAVRTPWVLVLDADERLDARARDGVRALAAAAPPDVMGFALERYDYLGEGRWASARFVRMFRGHPRIRYFASRAHAAVVPSIEALGGRIPFADAPLHHVDALVARDHAAKRAGMRARLEAEIASGGKPVMRCFLALELFADGDDDGATRELLTAIRATPRCEPIARLFLAQQHLVRGRLEEADAEAAQALVLAPHEHVFRGRSAAWVVRASAAVLRGDRERALVLVREALGERPSAGLHLSLAALTPDEDEARRHFAHARAANGWLLDPRIRAPGAARSIFRQQDALVAGVPPPHVLAARLGAREAASGGG